MEERRRQYFLLQVQPNQRYRGMERAYPAYRDDLEPDAPANLAFAQLVEHESQELSDPEVAVRLAESIDPRREILDVIELDAENIEAPDQGGQATIGFDVGSGRHSLLSWELRWKDETLEKRPLGPLLRLIGDYFRPMLNKYGLFEGAQQALYFCAVVTALQDLSPAVWESPGYYHPRVVRIRMIRSAHIPL